MINFDLFKLAFRNLWRRKGRTILTVVSVLIGTMSILLMLSLSKGLENSMDQMIEEMGGATLLRVSPSGSAGGGGFMGFSFGETSSTTSKQRDKLVDKDVQFIANDQRVLNAIPGRYVHYASLVPRDNKYSMWTNLIAIDMKNLTQSDLPMKEGQIINKSRIGEVMLGSMNFIYEVGGSGYSSLKEAQTPATDIRFELLVGSRPEPGSVVISNKPTYGTIQSNVSGVLAGGAPLDSFSSYISFQTEQALLNINNRIDSPQNEFMDPFTENEKTNTSTQRKDYDVLFVQATDVDSVKELKTYLTDELGFQVSGNMDMVESFQQQTTVIQWVLGGIGSIALLVSAIGITNTMLMSIYERKKEIGVMKVIGASVGNIRSLFLIESTLIGFLGGLVGLLLSLGISTLINSGIRSAIEANGGIAEEAAVSIITPGLAIFAVVFAALIGLIAGYMPARKATKLSAIDAIRGD
ncbi:MAG: ABC transporter permease [Fastidiosipilaceae bacterium]|jgi:putative ABC transport system permease protein